MNRVRVRFAPSPTGGLHIGGVRTALYNYLFAKQMQGDFIVRTEDTDRSRFVEGAEDYIFSCLKWCGIEPDESTQHGGEYGPYRQSERKQAYKKFADQLIDDGYAYYAFDTPDELSEKRKEKADFQYNQSTRSSMRNSLFLSAEETQTLLNKNTPYVVRIKMPDDETISFFDMVRDYVEFNSSQTDDKVLLKADGMPTYHLAVVVDDYLMHITHAFRGEEWLPSAPVHILLWKYLFGLDKMPQWAHLPLILKPDGNGKLSKRDGERLGIPVFAMNWTDPKTGDTTQGFKERGFLPQAFINMLALLGWNDGTDREMYTLEDLIASFSVDKIHKAGARFDYDKAKWYNHEWIKQLPVNQYTSEVKKLLNSEDIEVNDDNYLQEVIELVKDRCSLLPDFVQNISFFFKAPEQIDVASIQTKWNDAKQLFFNELIQSYETGINWKEETLETSFKEMAAAHKIKPGELLLPLRIMLVGGKFGPHVFKIVELIGNDETVRRIKATLGLLK